MKYRGSRINWEGKDYRAYETECGWYRAIYKNREWVLFSNFSFKQGLREIGTFKSFDQVESFVVRFLCDGNHDA